MRYTTVYTSAALAACLLLSSTNAPSVNALSIPSTAEVAKRDNAPSIWERAFNADLSVRDIFVALEKRRGGGGGGGRSGGSSSSSSGSSGSSSSSGSSGSSSGSSSSGSSSSSSGSTGSSSSSSSSGRTGSTSSTSNTGGSTRAGSGSPRTYGGGGYYAGGAATPYAAGGLTRSGIVPIFLTLALVTFFAGAWLYPVYQYPFHNPYNHYNSTTHQNQTVPVVCLCQEYSVCGCDENSNTTTTSYYDALVAANNASLARLTTVNGTLTLVINGTLDNGTTAPGGTDSAASFTMVENLGWCWMIGVVMYTAFAM